MAALVRRGPSYRIIVSMGYDVKGKQVKRTKTWRIPSGMTDKQARKEAEKQAVLFEEECKGGTISAVVKFQVFAEQWFEDHAKLNYRPSTMTRTRQIAERVYPVLGYKRLDKITAHDIQMFINSLAQNGANKNTGGPLSRKSIVHFLSFISMVFDYAMKNDMLLNNPCKRVSIPKYNANGEISRTKEKKILTIEETKKLLKVLETAPLKYKLFFNLAIYTGMRRGELLGLEWKDINFDTGAVSISRTSNYVEGYGVFTSATKTEQSIRTIYVPQNIIEILRAHKFQQGKDKFELGGDWVETDRLFTRDNGEPIGVNVPYWWLRKTCEQHGIPFYGIHMFRHLNASMQIRAGVDPVTVAASLGHSTPQTTLRIYSHAFKDSKLQGSNIIAQALGA